MSTLCFILHDHFHKSLIKILTFDIFMNFLFILIRWLSEVDYVCTENIAHLIYEINNNSRTKLQKLLKYHISNEPKCKTCAIKYWFFKIKFQLFFFRFCSFCFIPWKYEGHRGAPRPLWTVGDSDKMLREDWGGLRLNPIGGTES